MLATKVSKHSSSVSSAVLVEDSLMGHLCKSSVENALQGIGYLCSVVQDDSLLRGRSLSSDAASRLQ